MSKNEKLGEESGAATGTGGGPGAPTNGIGPGFATYAVPLFMARRKQAVNELSESEWNRFRVGQYDGDSWQVNIDDPQLRNRMVKQFHDGGEVLLVNPGATAGIILRKHHIRDQSFSGSLGAG